MWRMLEPTAEVTFGDSKPALASGPPGISRPDLSETAINNVVAFFKRYRRERSMSEEQQNPVPGPPRDVYRWPTGETCLEWGEHSGPIFRIFVETIGSGSYMTTFPDRPAEFGVWEAPAESTHEVGDWGPTFQSMRNLLMPVRAMTWFLFLCREGGITPPGEVRLFGGKPLAEWRQTDNWLFSVRADREGRLIIDEFAASRSVTTFCYVTPEQGVARLRDHLAAREGKKS